MKNAKKRFQETVILCLLALTFLPTFAFASAWQERVFVRWDGLAVSNSPINNPALLAEENYISARFSRTAAMKNAFISYETGAIVPIGANQTVAFTVFGTNSKEPIRAQSGMVFYEKDIALMASYAISPLADWNFGANLAIYRTPNFADPITNLALDIGMTYRIAEHETFGEHIVGLSVQNLLSPDLGRPEGLDLTVFDRPMNIKTAYFAHFLNKQINAGMALELGDVAASSSDFAGKMIIDPITGEISFEDGKKTIELDFSANLDFWVLRALNIGGEIGTSQRAVSAMINIPSFGKFGDFQVGYQYTSVIAHSTSSAHSFNVRGLFGNRR